MTKEQDVMAFMATFDKAFGEPGASLLEVIRLRGALIQEEYVETLEALALVEKGQREDALELLADGLVDLVYVVIGTAIAFGIPFDECWKEVQRTNMAKTDPKTGGPIYREDGKLLKPEGWEPPDLKSILKRGAERSVHVHSYMEGTLKKVKED